MSRLSDLFYKAKTLDSNSIEEQYIVELEADKIELLNVLESVSDQRIFEEGSLDRNYYLENKVHHILDKHIRSN